MLQKNYKFKLLIIAIIFMVFSLSQLQAQSGDVDGNGSVDIVDALLVAQYYVGLNPSPFNSAEADTNCDGSIDIIDALRIAQYYVGLVSSLGCGTTPDPTAPPTAAPTATPVPAATPDPTTVPTTAPTAAPTADPGDTPVPGGNPVNCSGYEIWNSGITYSEGGNYVQYNCNLYRNNYFSFNDDPELNSNNEWDIWVLQGPCSNSNCPMGEGPFKGCGQWDQWDNGGYTIYNNIWGGDAAGTQCIWINSYSNWGVTANHPNTSGVKSYPNVSKMLNQSLSSIGSLSSSFSVTVPSSGSYATTYDIWADSHQYEVMIWMNNRGEVGPIARGWNDDGSPIPESTNTSVGGHTWNIYNGNIGFQVISFVRTSNTNSATVNVKAILDYIRNQGWFGNVTIQEAQFGFEITSSSGGLDFTCNSYSMN